MAVALSTVSEAAVFLVHSDGLLVKEAMFKSQPLFFTTVNLVHGKGSREWGNVTIRLLARILPHRSRKGGAEARGALALSLSDPTSTPTPLTKHNT